MLHLASKNKRTLWYVKAIIFFDYCLRIEPHRFNLRFYSGNCVSGRFGIIIHWFLFCPRAYSRNCKSRLS